MTPLTLQLREASRSRFKAKPAERNQTMTTKLALDPAIEAHVAAINSGDVDAIMDTFTEDALVNDVSREFRGTEHIRSWIIKEMVGDHVTVEPVEVTDDDGLFAVQCKYDGTFDKTNLPD